MKLRKSDLTVEDFERGRKKSELKQALDEFIAMETNVVVIDPKEKWVFKCRILSFFFTQCH